MKILNPFILSTKSFSVNTKPIIHLKFLSFNNFFNILDKKDKDTKSSLYYINLNAGIQAARSKIIKYYVKTEDESGH